MDRHLGLGPESLARDQHRPQPVLLDMAHQVLGVEMDEAGVHLLLGLGQGEPGLDAIHGPPMAAQVFEAFGVGHALAGGHPVDLAGLDLLVGAHAVAVGHLTLKQIGQGGQADMRVRTHVHIAGKAGIEPRRSHMVEEDEGSHHAPGRVGEDAAHLESAQVLAPLLDHQFDHHHLPFVFAAFSLDRKARSPRVQSPALTAL